MFSLICVWIDGWVSNREAGDLRHYRAHDDVIVMKDMDVIDSQVYPTRHPRISETSPTYGDHNDILLFIDNKYIIILRVQTVFVNHLDVATKHIYIWLYICLS